MKTNEERIAAFVMTGPFAAEEEEEDAFSHRSGHYTRGTGAWLIGLGETTTQEPGEGDAMETVTAETICRIEGPEAETAADAIVLALNRFVALRKCAKALRLVWGKWRESNNATDPEADGYKTLCAVRRALAELDATTKEAKP